MEIYLLKLQISVNILANTILFCICIDIGICMYNISNEMIAEQIVEKLIIYAYFIYYFHKNKYVS